MEEEGIQDSVIGASATAIDDFLDDIFLFYVQQFIFFC